MIELFALLSGVFSMPPSKACAPESAVLSIDFETETPQSSRLTRHKNLDILEVPDRDGRVLQSTYIGNKHGSERNVVRIPIGASGNDFTLTYDLKFQEGFPFVKGGKLPGVGPDKPISGGDKIKSDGWSARPMWRREGQPVTYTYAQSMKGKYGDNGDVILDKTFPTGKWMNVSLHVKLNEEDGTTGSTFLYIDGERVNGQQDVIFRSDFDPHTRITTLMFETFFGGNDPSWAPKDADGQYINVLAWFDNMTVHQGLCLSQQPE